MDDSLMSAMQQNLPMLPHVALQVMESVDEPNTSAGELEALISGDQAIATRVLRIANSAFYAVSGTVSTLSNAIMILGFETIRSLVVAAACDSLHRSDSPEEKLFWDHALAVSVVAKMLARECDYAKAEEASTGGLIHDIGKVVMNQHLGDKYKEILDLVRKEGMTFFEAEKRTLGFTHADVGGMAVHKWNFSPSLEEVVFLHHNPISAQANPELCGIIGLANNICVKLGIGMEQVPDLELSETDSNAILRLDEARISLFLETVVSVMAQIPELEKYVPQVACSEEESCSPAGMIHEEFGDSPKTLSSPPTRD